MDEKQYKYLYNELRFPEDIERVHILSGLDKELLTIIHTQRLQRVSTRKYYVIKGQIPRLKRIWQNGVTITQLAKTYDFSPVLMGLLILTANGISRKEFWKIIRGEKPASRRILREMEEACKNDLTYSPQGLEIQKRRGKWGETLLYTWLERFKIKYRVEVELRGRFSKTPDCLLENPLTLGTREIRWIESKANFADRVEFNRNMKRQVIPYLEMFGPGMIVYWFGFIDGLVPPEGVYVVSREFFENQIIENGRILPAGPEFHTSTVR